MPYRLEKIRRQKRELKQMVRRARNMMALSGIITVTIWISVMVYIAFRMVCLT